MSNYFAHLPAAMQALVFGADGLGGQEPPPADDELTPDDAGEPGEAPQSAARRAGFLFPFKPRADADYLANVLGGPAKRTRSHETLVNDFAAWLATHGHDAACSAVIDLGLTSPPVIIEAKVIRAGRWAWAIREAVGQLYEYRYFQVVDPESSLIFLASEPIPPRWLDYLDQDRTIGAAWRDPAGFHMSASASRMLGIT
jgi:hypothetical protein